MSVYGVELNYYPDVVDMNAKESDRKVTSSPSMAGTCDRLSISTKDTVEMSEFGASSCEANPFSSLHAVSVY